MLTDLKNSSTDKKVNEISNKTHVLISTKPEDMSLHYLKKES